MAPTYRPGGVFMYGNRVFAYITISVLMLFALGTVAVAQEAASGITVSGFSEIKAPPDLAFVTFGVVVESANAVSAAQENARKTNAVIDAIVKFGIPKTDIETIGYSVSPIISYKENTPPVTVGYRVENQVRVRVRDLTKIGPLIDTAIGAGANNVQGVNFTIADDAVPRQQALVQAIRNAEAKARVIAETLGVRLGKVTSVTESSGFTPRPMALGIARAEAAPTPIIPGEIEVTANVTLVYAIL